MIAPPETASRGGASGVPWQPRRLVFTARASRDLRKLPADAALVRDAGVKVRPQTAAGLRGRLRHRVGEIRAGGHPELDTIRAALPQLADLAVRVAAREAMRSADEVNPADARAA